jgi:hypothetical protein
VFTKNQFDGGKFGKFVDSEYQNEAQKEQGERRGEEARKGAKERKEYRRTVCMLFQLIEFFDIDYIR